MGTPDFAVRALDALIAAGHRIVAVYTQPPRPAGRGQAVRKSPVHMAAEKAGLPVLTPATLKSAEALATFKAHDADAAVVVAYGLILPLSILRTPRLGCLNIHASLLPRWRGAAPIQRAILAGDHESGVAIMQMEEGLDTGPVLLAARQPITPDMNAGILHDCLADLGARLIVAALDDLRDGKLHARPQSTAGVTYATKITAPEARLDWAKSGTELARTVRAFAPRPGAWTVLPDGARLKVLAAEACMDRPEGAIPGTVLDAETLTVACGEGALRLLIVQREGKRALAAKEFQRGVGLAKGACLS